MSKTTAQRLRERPTEAEIRMWRLLYPLRTGGYHFRKQVAIGPYVADFACHHAKLIIEVDGGQHYTDQGRQEDVTRDNYLRQRGYCVLRFSNLDVLKHGEGVYLQVAEQVRTIAPRSRKAAS